MRLSDIASGYTNYFESHIDAEIALTHLPVETQSAKRLLSYFPVARMNPYQALLYQRGWENACACVPLTRLEDSLAINSGYPEYVHLHWVSQALKGVKDEAAADKRADNFCDLLNDIKTKGKQIIWSVHNTLPHNQSFESQEVKIRKHLCHVSSKIHILTKGTPKAVSSFFALPEDKLFYVPHPAYENCYSDFVSYEEARYEMGFNPDDFVFLFFGSIQKYKGLDLLLDAYHDIKSQVSNAKLVIAGKPVDKQLAQDIQSQADDIDIKTYLKTISERDLQYLYKGTNVAIYPYKATLNSGAAMLSLQFGQKFIAPDTPGFREISLDDKLLYQDSSHHSDLAEKMMFAVESGLKPVATRYTELLTERSPGKISDLFFSHLV